MLRSWSVVLLCLASLNTVARAQGADPTSAEPAPAEAAPAEPAPAPAPAEAVAPAPPPAAPMEDGGMGLRNGFSLSVGQEFGSGPSADFSGQLYGFDWRIGAKITDAIAAYLHTHLSFGTGEIGGASGLTGNFAAAIMGEYMLPMRVFVAGGAGYGVLNNPDGPLAEVRVGWYPLKKSSSGKARRLNVAFDGRWYFPGEAIGTVTHLALSLGYDRF